MPTIRDGRDRRGHSICVAVLALLALPALAAAQSRAFALSQVPGGHELEPHEETVLRLAFADLGEDVSLAKARGRLARGGRRFFAVLAEEMIARGLLDPDRRAVRVRLTVMGGTLMAIGVFGALAMVPLIATYGPWVLLVGAALAAAGITGLVMAVGTSALTDEGAREAARWRGFRRHLKSVASDRETNAQPAPSRWAVYAATFGLGYYWARYLKQRPGSVPAWFSPRDASNADAAYVAFMSNAGAQGHAGGAAGGSGAAGGGGAGAA